MSLTALSCLLLLAASAWFRGGTSVPLQWPMVWLGGLLLGAVIRAGMVRRGTRGQSAGQGSVGLVPLVKDPVVWLGLAFLLLLAVQWWNAGRLLVFDETAKQWVYSAPRRPHWPSAVTRGEAAEMLRWFFPAWCLLIGLRNAALHPHGARRLLLAVALNAGVLAAFGIVQYATHTHAIYWLQPQPDHFFATFGYANHAAAFFVLGFTMSAGLCLRELRKWIGWERRSWRAALPSGCSALLCFAGCNLSLSRVGVIAAWVLGFLICAYAVYLLWPQLAPPVRLNSAVGAAVAGCMAFFVLASPLENSFLDSRGQARAATLTQQLVGRTSTVESALAVWRESPWFGLGGWGYRYFVAMHMPVASWERLESKGMANTHCDPLQFLVEFGVVGTALLVASGVTILIPLFKAFRFDRELVVVGSLGLLAVASHSLIDLPFRSPAILYHWLAVAVLVPIAVRGNRHRVPAPERTEVAGQG